MPALIRVSARVSRCRCRKICCWQSWWPHLSLNGERERMTSLNTHQCATLINKRPFLKRGPRPVGRSD